MENYYKTFVRVSEDLEEEERQLRLAMDEYRDHATEILFKYCHPAIHMPFARLLYEQYCEDVCHAITMVEEMDLKVIHFVALFGGVEDFRDLYLNEKEKESYDFDI